MSCFIIGTIVCNKETSTECCADERGVKMQWPIQQQICHDRFNMVMNHALRRSIGQIDMMGLHCLLWGHFVLGLRRQRRQICYECLISVEVIQKYIRRKTIRISIYFTSQASHCCSQFFLLIDSLFVPVGQGAFCEELRSHNLNLCVQVLDVWNGNIYDQLCPIFDHIFNY